MKLSARGRNKSRIINISQPARKIGPHVTGIFIFAVVLFRIDQRLLITKAVPISILGLWSSCNLPCVHWLWLYDNPQPERRGEAFPAEWSRCFFASKRDEIAPWFCQGDKSQWCPSKHFYPKCPKKGPKLSQHVKTFDPASITTMADCDQSKLKRVNLMAHISLWVGSYHQCRYHQPKWRTLRSVGTNNPIFEKFNS